MYRLLRLCQLFSSFFHQFVQLSKPWLFAETIEEFCESCTKDSLVLVSKVRAAPLFSSVSELNDPMSQKSLSTVSVELYGITADGRLICFCKIEGTTSDPLKIPEYLEVARGDVRKFTDYLRDAGFQMG